MGPPPANFHRNSVTVISFDKPLFRTHSIRRHPIFYGRTGANRFDAPDGSFGVLYAGCDPFTAFIETFAVAAGTRIITTTALKEKALSELKAARALRLIDLTQSGTLMRIGADARLFSGSHDDAQLWSKQLHAHPCKADGLLYPSRLDPLRQSIALFEDRAPALIELDRQSWYGPGKLRSLLAEIAEHYELQLIETQFITKRKPSARAKQAGMFTDIP